MTITHVSVGGVMQGLGGPGEDPWGGFDRGGWALLLFDNEAVSLLSEVLERAVAFLFVWQTSALFAGSWGTGSWGVNQVIIPISVAVVTSPKYVASTTLIEAQCADTTVLSVDVAAAIGGLKPSPKASCSCMAAGA